MHGKPQSSQTDVCQLLPFISKPLPSCSVHYSASPHKALQKDSLTITRNMFQNLKKVARPRGLFGSWLEELRHRPKVDVCVGGEQVVPRASSLQSPLMGITPTEHIWVVHENEGCLEEMAEIWRGGEHRLRCLLSHQPAKILLCLPLQNGDQLPLNILCW